MTLSREMKQQIISLSKHTSKSGREIARDLGITHWSVQKTLKVYEETGSLDEHKEEKRGRRKKLTAADERLIVIQSKKDPKKTAREIQASSGPAVQDASVRTVQRTLVRCGRFAYRPVKVPELTKVQKLKRFTWAKTFECKPLSFWKEVIFG